MDDFPMGVDLPHRIHDKSRNIKQLILFTLSACKIFPPRAAYFRMIPDSRRCRQFRQGLSLAHRLAGQGKIRYMDNLRFYKAVLRHFQIFIP